jgi:uncharacterized UBP type Zn finger protein
MGTAKRCDHTTEIEVVAHRDGVKGCEAYLKTGGRWVSLRMCLTCGHVGCRDSSPGRHARQHWQATGHPLIQSVEPGQAWAWCYKDEICFKAVPSPSL